MKKRIYIDESGNNGIISYDLINKKFNYDQRYFTLCLFLPKHEDRFYNDKYNNLKIQHGINVSCELKGSELMTRRYNLFLEDFINQILNDEEFYITLYDKKFLVASFLAFNVLGEDHRIIDPQFHFAVIELFFKQSDLFFEPFFLTCQFPTENNVKKLLGYLVNYSYEDVREGEIILPQLKAILLNFIQFSETALKNILYEFENTTLNVNMTALGESLLVLKEQKKSLQIKI